MDGALPIHVGEPPLPHGRASVWRREATGATLADRRIGGGPVERDPPDAGDLSVTVERLLA